jgi:hypothetical protein
MAKSPAPPSSTWNTGGSAMATRTKGKRNAHLRALFPIPTHVQEVLGNLPEADREIVYRYLNRIRAAAMGMFVGPVPLRSEREPLLDRMAVVLNAAPGMRLFTVARQIVEDSGQSETAEVASIARWLVNEWKRRQALG